MPNWCSNKVVIRGMEKDREKFDLILAHHNEIHKGMDEVSPLMSFIPAPAYYLEQKGFNDGGYEWCLQNWGTKWPENDIIREDSEEGITLLFMSPWAPPNEGYKKISEFLPNSMIYHTWQEQGMDFYGGAIYDRGEVLFDFDGQISDDLGRKDFDNYDDYEAVEEAVDSLLSDLEAKMLKEVPPYSPAKEPTM